MSTGLYTKVVGDLVHHTAVQKKSEYLERVYPESDGEVRDMFCNDVLDGALAVQYGSFKLSTFSSRIGGYLTRFPLSTPRPSSWFLWSAAPTVLWWLRDAKGDGSWRFWRKSH